jgi:BlaI family penicillinase repressor
LNQPTLANAELALMETLWKEQLLSAREIRERLYPGASKAQHGTVQKLLQRLEEKGFVVRDRKQAVHQFSPSMGREAYAAGQLESLAAKLTEGSLAPLITQLLAEKKISSAEIKRLRLILDEDQASGAQA